MQFQLWRKSLTTSYKESRNFMKQKLSGKPSEDKGSKGILNISFHLKVIRETGFPDLHFPPSYGMKHL